MPELSIITNRTGDIWVSEDVIDVLGRDGVESLVDQVRYTGAACRNCGSSVRPDEGWCVVVRQTAVGAAAGVVHHRCGPPQVLDQRRNRTASISFARYEDDRAQDVQAFPAVRSDPAPRALFVVSQVAPFRARTESGKWVSPWFAGCLEAGFTLLAPPVLDAVPNFIDRWTLSVEGSVVTCGPPADALYVGPAETPRPWVQALLAERQCILLVAGVGISSDITGARCRDALDNLAHKGLLAGGTVDVAGGLGLTTTLGVSAALAQAEKQRTLEQWLNGGHHPSPPGRRPGGA